jgi:hypothetical protein
VCAVLSRTVNVCRASLRVGRCVTPITSSWKEEKKEVLALVSALDPFPHIHRTRALPHLVLGKLGLLVHSFNTILAGQALRILKMFGPSGIGIGVFTSEAAFPRVEQNVKRDHRRIRLTDPRYLFMRRRMQVHV